MKRHFLTAIFLSLTSISFCQNSIVLNGRVVDKKSGEALPYANVSIANSSLGTVSNEIGEFELQISRNSMTDTIVVSYLGYKTFKESISDLEKGVIIDMEEAVVILTDVIIKDKKLVADEILFKAIERLLSESKGDTSFKLEGFYREIHKTDNRTKALIETAFSIYDNNSLRPMQNIGIDQFRKVLTDKPDNAPDEFSYNHNNLMMLFGTSTNFNVLAKRDLKNGKTAWAIGKRPYVIESISTYNDRLVYVISHTNDDTSLRIIIDAENFYVLRSEYHTKSSAGDYKDYFWKYSGAAGAQCGFYETHQVYEYRWFSNKIYPYFFYRSDNSACYDLGKGKVRSLSNGNYQALINQVVLNVKTKGTSESTKRRNGLATLDYEYHPEFWKNYITIKDLPLDDSTLRELGGYENVNKKFK
jgi:CarboxypepD_reg-like domain